jgi:hypothetical protein
MDEDPSQRGRSLPLALAVTGCGVLSVVVGLLVHVPRAVAAWYPTGYRLSIVGIVFCGSYLFVKAVWYGSYRRTLKPTMRGFILQEDGVDDAEAATDSFHLATKKLAEVRTDITEELRAIERRLGTLEEQVIELQSEARRRAEGGNGL